MHRIAAIDNDELATPSLTEIRMRGDQHKRFRHDRGVRLAERAGRQPVRDRFDGLEWWCRV
jgi:hypothetical protein